MTAESPIRIAIVGAGPSGFYAAQALLDIACACEIDIIERLPTPYGLIRSGVAPDHPTTKTVQATFERTATDPRVRLFGNVTVGKEIALAELRALYDAVILAVGAPVDARLDIPGRDLGGVYGAAQFVGWYNGHPDFADLDPALDDPGAVVIGNGNVAIDIARILCRSIPELEATDLADHALGLLARSAIRDVHIVGRRGPVESKFTNVELSELGEMDNAVALAAATDLPDAVDGDVSPRDRRMKEKNLRSFQAFAQADRTSRPRGIRFAFFARPHEIVGSDRVRSVVFERMRIADGSPAGTGAFFEIPCGLVVSAIGYRGAPLAGLSDADRAGADPSGRIEDGLYAVGWFKRGPSGKIATNRADGDSVARVLIAETTASARPGRQGLIERLGRANAGWVDFAGWKHIDSEEVGTARPAAPRRKLTRIDEMLAVAARQR